MIELFLSPDICHSIFSAICHSLWQGLLISTLVLMLDKTGVISSVREKYYLYLASLCCLFFLFISNIFLDGMLIGTVSSTSVLPAFTDSGILSSNETISAGLHWNLLIPILWMGGSMFFLCRSILGLRLLQKLRRKGIATGSFINQLVPSLCQKLNITKEVKFFLVPDLTTPLIYGLVKPVILFPLALMSQLNPKQIEAIILHELVHIKQNDFLINLLQIVIESLLYFNPFTWWLTRQIRKYREYHCDDMVIQKSQNQQEYIEALYQTARYSNQISIPAIPLFTHKKQLAMRIKRMLNYNTGESYVASWTRLFIMLFVAMGLLSFSYLEDIKSSLKSPAISTHITLEKPNIENILPRIEALKLKERAALPINSLTSKMGVTEFFMIDSLPKTNERTEKLTRQIEDKSLQLEKLGEQLSEEIESKIESDLERLEELAEELEHRMEPFEKQWEEEFENSASFQRLQELEVRLSEELEKSMQEIEFSMQDEEMKEMEAKIEKMAEELEKSMEGSDGKMDPKKQEEFNKAMQEFSKQMQVHTEVYTKAHQEILSNPEFKALQEEMDQLRIDLEVSRPAIEYAQQIMDEEMQALHKEMNEIQVKINNEMNGFHKGMNEEMNQLVKEIEMLSQELVKEHEKLEKQN